MLTNYNTQQRCEKVDKNRESCPKSFTQILGTTFFSRKFSKENRVAHRETWNFFKTLDTYSFLLCLSPLSFFRFLHQQPHNLAIIRLDHAINRDSLRFNAFNIIYSPHSFLAHTHTYILARTHDGDARRLDYVQNYLQWYTGWSADRSPVRPQTSWRRSASITS